MEYWIWIDTTDTGVPVLIRRDDSLACRYWPRGRSHPGFVDELQGRLAVCPEFQYVVRSVCLSQRRSGSVWIRAGNSQ